MSDFQFLKDPITGKWVVSAPKRAQRPDDNQHHQVECPFCPGFEVGDEVYRVTPPHASEGWAVRVITNKFPFMPYHEVIVHSPHHTKAFHNFSLIETELILQTYRQRYNVYAARGQVYIFQNHGHEAGESVHHSHSQLVVIPHTIQLEIPPPDERIYHKEKKDSFYSMFQISFAGESVMHTYDKLETEHFLLYCPTTSEWPDEVWVSPKVPGAVFGEITDDQIKDLAVVLTRLVQIFDLRYGKEFPFNFYIYPGINWYLRLIPRIKVLGGFEMGINIMVNTQEPSETMEFIKAHFNNPDNALIHSSQRADYRKKV